MGLALPQPRLDGLANAVLYRSVNQTESTQSMVEQGEALRSIESAGPIERVQISLLPQPYRRRLRAIVGGAPGWLAEERY